MSLALSTSEGLVATPICTMSLPVNVFLTALITQAIPLTTTQIGLFSALPFVANFLHIFILPLVARWRPPKFITVAGAALHLATWVALALFLPALARLPPPWPAVWLLSWFLASSLIMAVVTVTWNSWIQEWVPERLRGKYFGWRNRLTQLSATVFLLLAGWLIGRWQYAIRTFQVIILASAALRLLSIRWQWKSPTRPVGPVRRHRRALREQWSTLLRARPLLTFVAFGCIWSFAANAFGAFYQVFMFDEVHFSAFAVGLTATLSQLGGALSLPAWGRLLDRYGNKPVMTVSLVLWQAGNLFWCFAAPRNALLLHAVWLFGGATSAGFILGQFTLLLRVVPREVKDLAIAFNLAVTSLFAAIAPVLGGAILQAAVTPGNALRVYHICFLVQPLVAVAGALMLLRVREPAAHPLGKVVGAMRNIRTLGAVIGLEFLVNYVFARPKPEGKNA